MTDDQIPPAAAPAEDGARALDLTQFEGHTPGPWRWRIEDHSMASLMGPREDFDHVITSSPCPACTQRAEPRGEWKWGRCMTPKLVDALLLEAAPLLLDEVKRLRAALSACAPAGRPVPQEAKLRRAITKACEIIERGDDRLLSPESDLDSVAGYPPDLSLKEWRELYVTLDSTRKGK